MYVKSRGSMKMLAFRRTIPDDSVDDIRNAKSKDLNATVVRWSIEAAIDIVDKRQEGSPW